MLAHVDLQAHKRNFTLACMHLLDLTLSDAAAEDAARGIDTRSFDMPAASLKELQERFLIDPDGEIHKTIREAWVLFVPPAVSTALANVQKARAEKKKAMSKKKEAKGENKAEK
jgi:hypothetical protein